LRSVTAPIEQQIITFSREFAAPAARVFAAHTRGAVLAAWTAPEGATIDIEQFAARTGGRWRYTVSDGTDDHRFHGVFHEVTPSQRIVRTFEFDGHVSLEIRTFIDLDEGRSRVDGMSIFPSVAERDDMFQGMDQQMEADYRRLDLHLAAEPEEFTPTIRYSGTTVDCADPGALADFYAALTGGSVMVRQPHWAMIRTDDGEIAFQGTPGYQPPVWPDPAASIQMHLDFYVTDRAAAEKRALELGATKYQYQPNDDHCTVFADPAGHAFCLSTWGEPA
jgi:uncharacterized protein YndB with AHSA1/START domain